MDLNATSLLTTAPSPNLDCPVKPDNDDSVGLMVQWSRQAGLSPSTDKLRLDRRNKRWWLLPHHVHFDRLSDLSIKVAEPVEADYRTVHTGFQNKRPWAVIPSSCGWFTASRAGVANSQCTSTGSVTFKVAELVEAGCRPTVHT